jgi:hypothetical protein
VPLLNARRAVVIEHDLATGDERRKLPQYNELYLKWELPGFAMIGANVGGRPSALPLMRSVSQGHFDFNDVARLAEVTPHIARLIHFSMSLPRRALLLASTCWIEWRVPLSP